MVLTKKDAIQLILVVAVVIVLTSVMRTKTPIGLDVGDNPIVQDVRQDQSSPTSKNPAADVTLIVFTDYRCPACRLAHPHMKRALAKDGRVRVVYKDRPVFGVRSERAARVAIASSYQGIYPKVHDWLMTAPSLSDDQLRAAVMESGGDWDRLRSDLLTKAPEIEDQLARNKQQAFSLGLGGTPGFLAGPMLVLGALE